MRLVFLLWFFFPSWYLVARWAVQPAGDRAGNGECVPIAKRSPTPTPTGMWKAKRDEGLSSWWSWWMWV